MSGGSYTTPDDGKASPIDLVDVLWNYWTTGGFGPGPSIAKRHLTKLVDEAFAASLLSEEGRPVRLQLVINLKHQQLTLPFDPFTYSSGNLVKLAPTIMGTGLRWIAISPQESSQDSLDIIGIGDPAISPAPNPRILGLGGGLSAEPEMLGMKLWVLGPGWIRIRIEGGIYFELRDCSIRFPFSANQIRYVMKWHKEVADNLDFSTLPVDKVAGEVEHWEQFRDGNAFGLITRTWGSILSRVSDARHGGTFLVVPEGVDLSCYVDIKYTLNSDQLCAAIWKRASFEPGLSNLEYRKSMASTDLDDAHFSQRDLARTADLVASLSAVDGATVLRCDLTLLGFGAEILETSLPNSGDLIKYGQHPSGRPEDEPLINLGMRHRSAYRFCEKVGGSIVFVVSQDGGLRVFCNVDGKVISHKGSTPEHDVLTSIRAKDEPYSKTSTA